MPGEALVLLGEMLVLSDTKKSVGSEDKDSNKEQEPRELVSCVNQ